MGLDLGSGLGQDLYSAWVDSNVGADDEEEEEDDKKGLGFGGG